MSRRLDWDRDGRDWPLREASRFIDAAGLRWHVQQLGQGPPVWLIHGTGASTHSWRDVAPILAERFTVVTMDLPGHGYTRGRPRGGLRLPAIAGALAALQKLIGPPPVLVGAHSAGAAIAVRMALDGSHSAPIVAFGAALLPFPGVAAPIFSGLARLLFANPFAASFLSRVARVDGQVDSFLHRATGSTIDARGTQLYARLFGAGDHVEGTIEMMADWDLTPIERNLPRLPVPLHLYHGDRDTAIRVSDARRAAALAGARLELLGGVGHLAHEERPALAAELIAKALDKRGGNQS